MAILSSSLPENLHERVNFPEDPELPAENYAFTRKYAAWHMNVALQLMNMRGKATVS